MRKFSGFHGFGPDELNRHGRFRADPRDERSGEGWSLRDAWRARFGELGDARFGDADVRFDERRALHDAWHARFGEGPFGGGPFGGRFGERGRFDGSHHGHGGRGHHGRGPHAHGGPDARFFGGRGGRGGPHFGGGRGGPPFGFGGGGPAGFGVRAGRKLASADLQLVLLALIGEKPRHGYDLIKALEERSNGFYVPSPGVIYPALTYLEEAGEAKSEAEGSRKLYQLTDAGRTRLEERRADVDAMLARLEEIGRNMDRVREAFAGSGEGAEGDPRDAWSAAPEVFEAMRQLRQTLIELRGASRERGLEIAAVLRRAADEIRGTKK